MTVKPFLLSVVTAGALAFAGCGSGIDAGVATTPAATGTVGPIEATTTAATAAATTEATPTTTEAAPVVTEAAPPVVPAATGPVTISMKDIAFTPKAVTVKAGTTITWSMDEPIPHNVVADSGADFKSEILAEGATYEFTPDTAGTIEYECTLHPGMVGTITVQ